MHIHYVHINSQIVVQKLIQKKPRHLFSSLYHVTLLLIVFSSQFCNCDSNEALYQVTTKEHNKIKSV